MGPPHWPKYPAPRRYGDLSANDPVTRREITRLAARLIAHDLASVGVNVNCMPVLDVPAQGSHDIVGDRAYGVDPVTVGTLGRAAAEGLMAGCVLPVIKHVPGHGRAQVDSHLSLPVVAAPLDELEAIDFVPFRMLADMPMAMTAHVVYTAIDPDAPATTSRKAVRRVIRGTIGYDGLLMSDDLSMQALSGTLGERAAAAFVAGCDIGLHCNGGSRRDGRRPGRRPAPVRQGEAAGRRGDWRACGIWPSRSTSPRPAPASTPRSAPRSAPRSPDVATEAFEEGPGRERAAGEPTLVVDVDGFEGPLDLLLELARRQKVDLSRISILALAEQYLAFIEEARRMRLELAADYLVMAAWLAYLKSRLLLPEPPKDDEPPAADLAAALAFRLQAARGHASGLRRPPGAAPARSRRVRPRHGRRRAYGGRRPLRGDALRAAARLCRAARQVAWSAQVDMPMREVWTLAEARELLERALGTIGDWASLDELLARHRVAPAQRATVRASSFSASLELAREGVLDIRQEVAFGPLYLRTGRACDVHPRAAVRP